ncbi:hypothetical protein [Sorangium cellulosum]|uniref:hypothetical protein n=1 Tax=Sorangium cellulosum TaxID=56 RepID=UPI001F1F533D|nr:hypothetical protein [Sorangium cellulosum]
MNDDGTSNGYCWGQCVHEPPASFRTPMLVWTGPEALAPSSCDELATIDPETSERIPFVGASPVFIGRALPVADHGCPVCDCMGPSCALPSIVTASELGTCSDGPGDPTTPFHPPPGWDGSCVSPGFLEPEQFASISIGPTQRCTPFARGEPPQPLAAETGDVAVACGGRVESKLCPDPAEHCMLYQQQTRLPDGWRHCIVSDDASVEECPQPEGTADPRKVFSEKVSVFYDHLVTTPACTPCACDVPETNRCEALVYTYEDRACSDMIFFIRVNEDEEGSCVVPVSTSSLGSLSATWITNEPGRCTPRGGEPFPEVKRGEPRLLCCLPRES